MPETVLYVPGFPGTHLRRPDGTRFFLTPGTGDPLLHGPDNLAVPDHVTPGDPIKETLKLLFLDVGKKASTLYALLDKIGCNVVPFGWDWRRPAWEGSAGVGVGSRLRKTIEDEHQKAGKPITVIAHSAGGLVVRALLEATPQLARKLKRLIAFGVPWAGAVKALEQVCGRGGIAPVLSPARVQQILCRAWAAIDTLPPDTAASLGMTRRAGAGNVSPLFDTTWLAALPAAERTAVQLRVQAAAQRLAGRSRTIEIGGEPLEVVNVVGWGEETVDLAEFNADGSAKPFQSRSSIDSKDKLGYEGGDRTVPRRSAAWLQPKGGVKVTTYHLPVGWLPETRVHTHATLWRNPGGRNLLRHHLGGAQLEPFAYAALDSGDTKAGSTSTQVRVRAVALDDTGRPLPGARIKTLDLTPGPQIEQTFDPTNDGRHVMAVPLARMRTIAGNTVNNHRFAVEILWTGGGQVKIPFGFFRNKA